MWLYIINKDMVYAKQTTHKPNINFYLLPFICICVQMYKKYLYTIKAHFSQIRMGPQSSQGALGTTKQDFGLKRVAHLA